MLCDVELSLKLTSEKPASVDRIQMCGRVIGYLNAGNQTPRDRRHESNVYYCLGNRRASIPASMVSRPAHATQKTIAQSSQRNAMSNGRPARSEIGGCANGTFHWPESHNGRFLRHRPERSERCLNYGNCTSGGRLEQTTAVCRRPSVKTMLCATGHHETCIHYRIG